MSLAPYRAVLSLPAIRRLVVFGILARVPLAAAGVVLTLHVVTTLHLGYAEAGVVGAASTIGIALGSPWRGRAVDRAGLRRALLPSLVVVSLAWGFSPFVGYPVLVVIALVGGVFAIPIFAVIRLSMSVLVPPEQRKVALALDSIGVEVSYMLGPAAGVAVATAWSTRVGLLAVCACTVGSGLALYALNPPTRSAPAPAAVIGAPAGPVPPAAPGVVPVQPAAAAAGPVPPVIPATAARPGRRWPAVPGWLSAQVVAVLAATGAATVVLSGTDVGIVAHLRSHGAIGLSGLVFVAWGLGSMVGGLIYGGMHRVVSPVALLLALAVLTVPVGLAPGPAALMLAVMPAGLLCAPVIVATADAISRLVPERFRGEALGWHGAALNIGSAGGAPLAGAAIDAWGPWSGFAAVGSVAALLALAGLRARGRVGSTEPARQPAYHLGRR